MIACGEYSFSSFFSGSGSGFFSFALSSLIGGGAGLPVALARFALGFGGPTFPTGLAV